MNNLHELMGELERQVPEIKYKHDEVTALIKQHIHNEKYFVWFMINLHFLKRKWWGGKHYRWWGRLLNSFGLMRIKEADMFYNHLKEHTDAKLETHSDEAWGSYERNLEWVKKYAPLKASR